MADRFQGQPAQNIPFIFSFGSLNLRGVCDPDGTPWFSAGDLCAVLGFANPRDALANHVDQEDVAKRDTLTSGGVQAVNHVNESGMYSLIFGSAKPEAKKFKRFVTSEMLPAIRKTGHYVAPSHVEKAVQPQQQVREPRIKSDQVAAVRHEMHKASQRTGQTIMKIADDLRVLFGFSSCTDIAQADYPELIATIRSMVADDADLMLEIDKAFDDLEDAVNATTIAQLRLVELGVINPAMLPHLSLSTSPRYVAPDEGRRQGGRDIAVVATGEQKKSAYVKKSFRKLTEADIQEMCRLKRAGWLNSSIAKHFDVTKGTVSQYLIKNGLRTFAYQGH
jgi:prophage antirepressor-like protein